MRATKDPGFLFFTAVRLEKSLLIQFLCAAGQDCPAVLQGMYNRRYDDDQFTLLTEAVQKNNLDIVNALLDVDKGNKGTERSIVNMQDRNGATTLMYARSLEMVRALIDAGANVNMQAKNGNTALTILIGAEARQRNKCVQALLDAHANVNIQGFKGRTALMAAAEYGRIDVLHTLLAARNSGLNLDLDAQDDYGITAVVYAGFARSTREEAVRILLEAGAHP